VHPDPAGSKPPEPVYPPPPYQAYPPQSYPPQQQPQQQQPQQQQPQQQQPQQQQPQSQHQQQQQTVVNIQTASLPTATAYKLGRYPVPLTCPYCSSYVNTLVTYSPGSFTWLICFLLCIFGFALCCLIPFCVDSCKDAHHSCPNCRGTIGFCGADIMTNTQYVIGVTVWIIAAVLFITCLWLCIFIPFVTNACKDVKHSCPNCNNQIGPGYPPSYPAASTAQPGYPTSYPAQQQHQQPPPPPAYPAAGGYQGQPAQHHVVVMQQQPVVVNATIPRFNQSPVWMVCPNCHNNVQTTVYYKIGGYTWLIAAILFFVGLSLGCCLIPFCVNSCKDVEHICPSCNRMVGRFHRL
uniref:LITAF domain-containing protein n=2 Tax=Macrostomum lignano TaxID=282301 RepID=A0A1I8FVK1_9PLAT